MSDWQYVHWDDYESAQAEYETYRLLTAYWAGFGTGPSDLVRVKPPVIPMQRLSEHLAGQ